MPRYKREIKSKAIELLKTGKPLQDIQSALKPDDVSLAILEKWQAELKSPGPAPVAGGAPPLVPPGGPVAQNAGGGSGPSSPPQKEGPGKPLAELLAGHPGADPFSGGTPPPPPPEPPKAKPMDPEALLAVVQVTKTVVVQTASAAWKVPLSDEEVIKLSEFSEAEKKSLKVLAPYAAEYTSSLETYAKPVMAVLFAGIVAISTMSSLAILKTRRKRETKSTKEPSTGHFPRNVQATVRTKRPSGGKKTDRYSHPDKAEESANVAG